MGSKHAGIALIELLIVVTLLGSLFSCGDLIGDVEDSARPLLLEFSLTSGSPTRNNTITFSLVGEETIRRWLITENSTEPDAGAAWLSDKPSSYVLSSGDGEKTIYAWGASTQGFISLPRSLQVRLDTEEPTIDVFALTSPDPTNSLTISFTLSGTSDITGWLINESATAPDPASGDWLTAQPTEWTLPAGDGLRVVYAWAKDAAGNVSSSRSLSVTISTSLAITQFELTSSDPTNDPVIDFLLSGGADITHWLINESPTAPELDDASWTAVKPASYTLSAGDGQKTVHAWAKDAAGNVSASLSFGVFLDTAAPTVTGFTLTSDTPTSDPAITFALTETDPGGVDGSGVSYWLVNESATPPLPEDSGWSPTRPSGYTLSGGYEEKTVYPWVKDDAENVSAVYGSPIAVGYYEQPVASYNYDTVLTGNQPIVIDFSLEMDTTPSELTVGGTLAGDWDGVVDWNPAGDELTLTPTSIWTETATGTITVDAQSADGIAADQLQQTFDVRYHVFVNDDGTAGSPGTRWAPMPSIANAITLAVSLYRPAHSAEIHIAEGTYGAGIMPAFVMADGVSVYGGYDDASWEVRDISGNPTEIVYETGAAGTSSDPNRAVTAGSGFTTSTVIDGLSVTVGSGTYAAAIVLDGSESFLTVQNCIISGAASSTGAATNAHGIYLDSSSATLTGNTIDPGWNSNGGSSYSYGVYNNSSDSTISGNTIYGGRGGAGTTGIWCESTPSPFIDTNPKIDCGGDSTESFGILSYNCSPDVDGNIFTKDYSITTMYFVWETAGGNLNSFTDNHFDYYNTNYYHDEDGDIVNSSTWSSQMVTTAADGEDYLSSWGNTRANP